MFKVAFINVWDLIPNGHNLGLLYVISAVKSRGYEVDLLDLHYIPHRIHRDLVSDFVNRTKPNFVGFSVTSFTYPRALSLAKMIKKNHPDIKIVFGGIHPTLLPEQTIASDSIDAICIGEGEDAFSEYLEYALNNNQHKVEGFWYKKEGIIIKGELRRFKENIDEYPFPAKEYLDLKKYLTFSFLHIGSLPYLASRGCPYNCTYCNVPVVGRTLPGRFYRVRSPENVILEIEQDLMKYAKLGFTNVAFVDDTFGKDITWLEKFVKLFKKEKLNKYLTWSCQTRADVITHQWAKLAADSGCIGVCIGAETGDEEFRRRVYKKNISNTQLISAIEILKKYKILGVVAFLITGELETKNNFDKTYRFIKKTKPHICLIHKYIHLPKAELSKRLEKEGFYKPNNKKELLGYQIKLQLYSLFLKIYYLFSLGCRFRKAKRLFNKQILTLVKTRIPTRNASIADLLFRGLILYVELIRR